MGCCYVALQDIVRSVQNTLLCFITIVGSTQALLCLRLEANEVLALTPESKVVAKALPQQQASVQGVNYAIQNGCHLSRARIYKFRHNDMVDLERVLQDVALDDRRNPRFGRGAFHTWYLRIHCTIAEWFSAPLVSLRHGKV